MALVNLIKQASMGAFENSNPVAIMFGTITRTNPLEVNVEQRFTLTRDFLIFTEIFNQRALQRGDKVILLRVQGGQQYVVLDRVV